MKGNKNNEDIFKQAAEESLSKIKKEKKIEIEKPIELSQKELAEIKTKKTKDYHWEKLEKAITGELADKFLNIIKELPDRDFVRYYLKSLEYFKPKVVRQEKEEEKNKDLTINVNLVKMDEDGNLVELNLNENTNTYE